MPDELNTSVGMTLHSGWCCSHCNNPKPSIPGILRSTNSTFGKGKSCRWRRPHTPHVSSCNIAPPQDNALSMRKNPASFCNPPRTESVAAFGACWWIFLHQSSVPSVFSCPKPSIAVKELFAFLCAFLYEAKVLNHRGTEAQRRSTKSSKKLSLGVSEVV